MEKLPKEIRQGVNAQLIAKKCGCSSSVIYKMWDGTTGKWKTDLYVRVMSLTKKVAAAYDEPQL